MRPVCPCLHDLNNSSNVTRQPAAGSGVRELQRVHVLGLIDMIKVLYGFLIVNAQNEESLFGKNRRSSSLKSVPYGHNNNIRRQAKDVIARPGGTVWK